MMYLPDTIRKKVNTSEFRALSQNVGYQISKHIPPHWLESGGEGIKVAVLDTGCQVDHVDLVGSIDGMYNATTAHRSAVLRKQSRSFWNFLPWRKTEEICNEVQSLSSVADNDSHGSHVSGIITANNNVVGMVGVAPKSMICVIKVLGDDGSGSFDWIVDGINQAINQGADVINMSLGATSGNVALHRAIKAAYQRGIPVICAAGNSGTKKLDYPAVYPETIAVGAIDRSNMRATWSQTGPNLDFMAPGVDILSTVPTNQYMLMSGTCLTGDSLVYTPTGPVKMSDLTKEDTIYSFDENSGQIVIRKVNRQWSNGIKKTYKINTNTTSLKCTDNHPVLVRENDNLIWKNAGLLEKGDEIVCCNSALNKSTEVNIEISDSWFVQIKNGIGVSRSDVKGLEFSCGIDSAVSFLNGKYGMRYSKIKSLCEHFNISRSHIVVGSGSSSKFSIPMMDKKLAYLCGFYLGDGWITKNKLKNGYRQSVVCFAQCNINEVNARFNRYFSETFLTELTLNRKGRWYYRFHSAIADIFEQLCGSDRAKDKKIPNWIFTQNEDNIRSFISGLIDSDGNIKRKGYCVGSSSKELICGLASLCDYIKIRRNNVGYRTRKVQAPNSKKPTISHEYSLTFSFEGCDGVKQSCGSIEFEKYSNISTLIDVRTSKVTEIKSIGNQEVFDIEVDGLNNFIVDNVVVHNSMSTPWLSGVVALILAKHRKHGGATPINNVEDIREHLRKATVDLGRPGRDQSTGFGLIDVRKIESEIESMSVEDRLAIVEEKIKMLERKNV